MAGKIKNGNVRPSSVFVVPGSSLGSLHLSADVKFLNNLAGADPDPDVSEKARAAAEEIQSFLKN